MKTKSLSITLFVPLCLVLVGCSPARPAPTPDEELSVGTISSSPVGHGEVAYSAKPASSAGLYVVTWTAVVVNMYKIKQTGEVTVTFYDANGKVRFADSAFVMLDPHESYKLSRITDAFADDALSVKKAELKVVFTPLVPVPEVGR